MKNLKDTVFSDNTISPNIFLKRHLPLALMFILVCGIGYILFQNKDVLFFGQQSTVDELTSQERDQLLQSMYDNEPPPVFVANSDSEFGSITEGVTEDVSGVLVFTGYNGTYVENSSMYFLDLSTEDPIPVIPDFIIDGNIMVNAEFLDKESPADMFVGTISTYSSAKSDYLGVHLYKHASDTVSYFDSVAGAEQRRFAWAPESGLLAMIRYIGDDPRGPHWADIDNW